MTISQLTLYIYTYIIYISIAIVHPYFPLRTHYNVVNPMIFPKITINSGCNHPQTVGLGTASAATYRIGSPLTRMKGDTTN